MQVFRSLSFASFFPLLLAGLLAGMTYWLEITSRPQKADNDGNLRHDPDYIVTKFNVRRYSETGELQHTLIADEMRHFPDNDTTHVTEPRLIYHRVPATFINAREALVDDKGEHIELLREVRVLRAGLNNKPGTEFNTESLHSYPDDELVRSDVPVLIRQGMSQVTGDTLQSNNMTAMHTLEGNVRGTFHRGRPATFPTPPPAQSEARLPPLTRRPTPAPAPSTPAKSAKKSTEKPAPAKPKVQGKPPTKAKPQAKSQPRSKPPAKTKAKATH